MGKRNTWTVEVDGIKHVIQYKKGFKCKLIVDDNEKIIKSKNPIVNIIEESINLGSKDVQLVVIGAKADLAVDGVYLNSKKAYVPIKELPKWAWVFVGACMLPVVVFLGGVFNVIFGLLGSIFCLTNALSQSRSTIIKVILNVIITIAVWYADITMINALLSTMR